MDTLAYGIGTVKSYSVRLAELEAAMSAAHRADDASAWLAAWNAHQDLLIAQDLEEHPSVPDDDFGPPAEPEDGPSELDSIWNTYYALGYDCADVAPSDGLGTVGLWVARLAYERGWVRGMEDRRTWLDAMEWESIEAEEAEVRGVLAGRPAWDWDADDVVGRNT